MNKYRRNEEYAVIRSGGSESRFLSILPHLMLKEYRKTEGGDAWVGFMVKGRPEYDTTNQCVYVSLSVLFSLPPLAWKLEVWL